MNKLSKAAVLLFVLVLTITGTGHFPYGETPGTGFTDLQDYHSHESYAEGRQTVFCINPAAKTFVTSVNHFPVPDNKDHFPGSGTLPFLPETAIIRLASQYISRSVEIYPGLTNNDIIFPFHYFW